MSDPAFLFLLYALAGVILVAEIFIPSQGILSVMGVGVLIGAIVTTFRVYGEAVGAMAVISSLVAIPVFAVVAVRIWPRTKIGRLIAPPNPVYKESDFAAEAVHLRPLISHVGVALSPLRPVGTCEFKKERVECIAESGLIEAGVKVRAVGVRGRNLIVTVDVGSSNASDATV